MADKEAHPLVVAITPLVERLNAELVSPGEAQPDDVPLLWDGEPVVAVRLSRKPEGGVNTLLAEVAEEFGRPLHQLSRTDKQQAVLRLEERGAFEFRKSAEIVAEALGVTRFTVYNYLNRARDQA
ncbi:helix-turn-helix domain-containing protein [Kribbella sp. NPDC049227]|uniref:helix-turn-helix domain-containing protein n=1 Tax=Kribbella sp. NPDC049227 TaxID=3364113 RepID=UPI0037173E38